MKCDKCGFEMQETLDYCPNCGNQMVIETENPIPNDAELLHSPLETRLLSAFRDKMFLSICILLSAFTVIQILSASFPIIQILFTVFLWIIYASARKNEVNDRMMRCVSGTIYAQKIIIIVLGALLLVCGIIVAVVMAVAGNSIDLSQILNDALNESDLGAAFQIPLGITVGLITSLFIIVIFVLIAVMVVAYISLHIIHRFAKSLHISVQNGNYMPVGARAAKIWILVTAIFAAFGALGSIADVKMLLTNGTTVAIYILAYILIGKYLEAE